MDPDLFFVIGVLVMGFSVPAIIGSFSEGRPPRAAAIMIMIGGGMLGIALWQKPGGYTVGDTPQVFSEVIGKYIN